MTPGPDQQTFQRAVAACIVGLLIQIALAITVAVLGLYAENPALNTLFWYLLGGLPVWIVLLLVYHQYRLERIESLEAEQLKASSQPAGSMFDTAGDELEAARRRLAGLLKWGFHGVSQFLVVYYLVVGIWALVVNWNRLKETTQDGQSNALLDSVLRGEAEILVVMIASVLIAFVAFAAARFLAGMTKVKEWQLLRGGASHLMTTAFMVFLIFLGGVFGYFGDMRMLSWMGIVIPAMVIVSGVEIELAFLLGAYRPRRPGEMPRPAFDSRVFGILTSPKSLAGIINETINYQFGFEVSKSWFYRLLGKAITPLVAFGMLVLLGTSSIVIVEPHQQAIIMHFGEIVGEPVDSGVHFKLPWPAGTVQKFDVERVQQINVGSIESRKDEDVAILWTNQHTEGEEKYMLVAPTPVADANNFDAGDDAKTDVKATGMSLVAADITLQYRIVDLLKYVRSSTDPKELLKSMAERRVNEYFAGYDIDTLLGEGTFKAGEVLRRQLQADLGPKGLDMGVEVTAVLASTIHPPQKEEVATTFQKQISALQERERLVREAERNAVSTLAKLAGSHEKAMEINDAIKELNALQAEHDTADAKAKRDELQAKIETKLQNIEDLLNASKGEAAAMIYEARAYRWRYKLSEQSAANKFRADQAAYAKAPNYFIAMRYFEALREGLKGVRKYVVAKGVEEPTVRLNDVQAPGIGGMFEEE